MPRFESSSPVENAPGRRRHRRGLLLGAIAAPLLASGCIGTPTSGLERMENAIGQGEMSIDEPRIIVDSRGIVDLEVDSFGGNVRVDVVPGMKGTTVDPVLRAFHGHLRRDEADASLEELDYRVELRGGELDRETLVLGSTSDGAESHFQGVDFYVRTGELGRVNVKTARGRVWIKNNTGGVDIETTMGDIRVITDHPMTEPMTMVTRDASIDYRAAPGSTGEYDLRSVGGRVYQRFTDARVTATSVANGSTVFVGTIGGGTNPVILRTTYGDIRVAVTENATGVGPIIRE